MKIDLRKFRFSLISHLIKCREPLDIRTKISRKRANEIYLQIKNSHEISQILEWAYPRIGISNIIPHRSIKLLNNIYTTELNKQEIKELQSKRLELIKDDQGNLTFTMI